jgi:hypothetical protein
LGAREYSTRVDNPTNKVSAINTKATVRYGMSRVHTMTGAAHTRVRTVHIIICNKYKATLVQAHLKLTSFY